MREHSSEWKRLRSATAAMVAVVFMGLVVGCPALPAGCTADADCDDGDACTTDTCDVTSGACANEPVEDCAPVVVTASVEGDAVPGGTVTATATVDIRDGSTVESYSWTQSNSVDVTIGGATTATATVALPDTAAYKDELLMFLAEPPIGEDEFPLNVPLHEGEFPGGIQDRFYVVGLAPFTLEEAGLVALEVAVTTTSGTYTGSVEVHTELPWPTSPGLLNVPVGRAVLLQGKTQDAYDWALSSPGGSGAALADATSQNPYFTPDVSGTYRVTVTNTTVDPAETVTLDIIAGTWEGAVTGQDADGRPVAATCGACHNDTIARDMFTPWAQTGHADIFSVNLDTSTHYSTGCFDCHTVGYDPDVDNGGMDDASDYDAFLDAFTEDGASFHANPDNWTNMLADFPASAQMGNIQCENCHGPNNGGAHTTGASRVSLSSDVCAACHGEPLRHGRFQQWQISGHANYELAIDESDNENCSRCHTANGFLEWLPILLDDDPATDPLASLDAPLPWTADEAHPQTCVTCHDPHDIGTTTGIDTNATVRISGDTPPLIAGFSVAGAGRGAICMTCHNSRRGLRNDENFADSDTNTGARAPHGSAQTDVLMGQNAYLVDVGVRGAHSLVDDTCVNCHMEQTPPPDLLSYDQGGTNHTFFASADICSKCHSELSASVLQAAFQASSDELQGLIEEALLQLIGDLIDAGNTLDLDGEGTITDASTVQEIVFGESHGRQAVTFILTDGTTLGPFRMGDVSVVDGTGATSGLHESADDDVLKAGWNWNLANNDGSKGVHNPSFVLELLGAAIDALDDLAAE